MVGPYPPACKREGWVPSEFPSFFGGRTMSAAAGTQERDAGEWGLSVKRCF